MNKQTVGEGPPLHMIDTEADALWTLAQTAEEQHPLTAELLMGEIERAETHTADAIPRDVVTMNSTVVFADEEKQTEHTVRLVYPREADLAAGRVSIMTPIGAGLIGMREGECIDWPDRGKHTRRLRIVTVRQPQTAE